MVRVKSRYLLCEINVTDRNRLFLLTEKDIYLAVKEAVARIHGDYGTAMCSTRFCVKYLNAQTGMVFLRFPKMGYKLLWSALPFITSIGTRSQKTPCFLNCLHVGDFKTITGVGLKPCTYKIVTFQETSKTACLFNR
ncbi:ribonuclease P/MRP protein subunit POP5 isoform X3 [Festucalex cinctus]